ncbi:MAG: DUF2059 domain-containing protein [Thermomonas sp.]
MRRLGLALALALSVAFAGSAFAADPVPPPAAQQASAADIDRLLKVMDMQAMMAGTMEQMSTVQAQMVDEAFGSDLSDADRKRMQSLTARTDALVKKRMSWTAIEPVIRKVYLQLFSKQEVDAMTAFYGSPEGSSILRKAPQAMALTMQEMQPLMQGLMADIKADIDNETKPKD